MKILTLFAAILYSTSFAHAMGRGSGPCEPAMDTFCGGLLEFSHDAVMKCLKQHEEEVSYGCKELLKSYKPASEDEAGTAAPKTDPSSH